MADLKAFIVETLAITVGVYLALNLFNIIYW